MLGEPTGPLRLDFLVRETLPLPDVCFAVPLVDDEGSDPDGVRDDRGRFVRTLQVAARDHVERSEFLRRAKSLLAPFVGERWIGLTLPLAQRIPFTLAVSKHEDAS